MLKKRELLVSSTKLLTFTCDKCPMTGRDAESRRGSAKLNAASTPSRSQEKGKEARPRLVRGGGAVRSSWSESGAVLSRLLACSCCCCVSPPTSTPPPPPPAALLRVDTAVGEAGLGVVSPAEPIGVRRFHRSSC
ncbi:hypothetical protein F2P81_016598 [Scophthalmus maximus]|uniref:Uncharacterized protein n=1 Tax=Scophthalmus maximus TaxID=52904 RepID=A0A6A4SD08_SCOMX|nr:hypothetical protein F2P81_016598 [Scophthalmus maximus]